MLFSSSTKIKFFSAKSFFVPDNYICEKENLKKHSICFYETENGWFEGFVGEKNKIIAASRGCFPEGPLFFLSLV